MFDEMIESTLMYDAKRSVFDGKILSFIELSAPLRF